MLKRLTRYGSEAEAQAAADRAAAKDTHLEFEVSPSVDCYLVYVFEDGEVVGALSEV